MYRFRLSQILLCGLILPFLPTTLTDAQTGDTGTQALAAPYQKWLDEDVCYLITEEERAEFGTLNTDQRRDTFVAQFWERRNLIPGSTENHFKEEHYRRLAYVNQHFAAGVAGYKTDRGRIYIVYGRPDEREQHPGRKETGIPASAPLQVRYPSDVWRYHFIKGVGKDVTFEFIDICRCGQYQLREDPTKKPAPSIKDKEHAVLVKQSLPRRYRTWLTEDLDVIVADEELARFGKYCKSSTSSIYDLKCLLTEGDKSELK